MRISPDYIFSLLEQSNDYDDGANGWLRGGHNGVFAWFDDDANDRDQVAQKFRVTVTELEVR